MNFIGNIYITLLLSKGKFVKPLLVVHEWRLVISSIYKKRQMFKVVSRKLKNINLERQKRHFTSSLQLTPGLCQKEP